MSFFETDKMKFVESVIYTIKDAQTLDRDFHLLVERKNKLFQCLLKYLSYVSCKLILDVRIKPNGKINRIHIFMELTTLF